MQQLREHWFVAATSQQVHKKPFGCMVLATPLVLFRNGDGIVAMSDRCPHRNAPLSAGRIIDGTIQCPYHGWRFNAQGDCTFRPGVIEPAGSAGCVETFSAVERHGLVWVNLALPITDSLPTQTRWWDDRRFARFTWCDVVESSFVDGIENLLDATHTPFVHTGIVRSANQTQRFKAIVRIKDGAVEAEYCDEGKQSGWISTIFERDRGSSFGRFIPPCIAELEYTSRRGTEFVLNSHFTPETEHRTRVHSTFFIRKTRVPMFLKKWLLTPFFRRVLKQDQQILKLQQHNIGRFGSTDFLYWEGDLIRGPIETWLQTGNLPDKLPERTIDFEL